MNTPQVSIITPSYNEEDFIRETLESIKNQKYENIEHIVIDGGSTDNTKTILEEYEEKYDLRWYSSTDDGLYDAIEKGFQEANGEILTWLNANDLYFPWTVNTAVKYLSQDGIQWITGRRATLDEHSNLRHIGNIKSYYKQSWIRRGWYHGRGLGWFSQPSMLWTKSLWEKTDGFRHDVGLAGEYYLWQDFAQYSDVKSVDTILGAHREHEGQLSADEESWYQHVETGWIPALLGKFNINEVYSIYRMYSRD
jgi:glycosyltransferase involved in cell wall biosynthesis